MSPSFRTRLPASAQRFLIECLDRGGQKACPADSVTSRDIQCLVRADLIERHGATWHVSAAGRAYLARIQATASASELDPFLAQHLPIGTSVASLPEGSATARMDQAESPLAWLARRKGRNQKPLIAPEQLLAGERLRADFTRAQLTPRVTANWDAAAPRSQAPG